MKQHPQTHSERGEPGYTADPWQNLRELTDARIALGRAGSSLPTAAHLDFQLAHALARDAVHTPFDAALVAVPLQQAGLRSIQVASQAADRAEYLQRPDLGRQLAPASRSELTQQAAAFNPTLAGSATADIALVIADGLSALATHRHASAITLRLHRAFTRRGLSVSPIVIASGARVALADEIGELFGVRQVIILLGERPGLSSADSLGAYLTWAPRIGRNDAQRNCVSNIRPDGGLSYEAAAHKLIFLALEAARLKLSGVDLKDNSPSVSLLN